MLGKLFRRRSFPRARPLRWNLSDELLRWSEDDGWTIGDSMGGTLIVGATGSGKTTGSGRTIAVSMLKSGYSGLVLTAKKSERALWESYCREAGRSSDLVVVGPNEPWRFNFLQHEVARGGVGAGLVPNIQTLLVTVSELGDRLHSQGGGHDGDRYWRDTMNMLVRAAIDVLLLAKGSVSVPDLYRLIVSAPTSLQEKCSKEWQANSFCFECLKEADRRARSDEERQDLDLDAQFFLVKYPALASRTRSIVESVFISMVDLLNRGLLRRLFCGETNFGPEMLDRGKIILIDLPIMEYGAVGLFGQGVVKYCFQKSLLRREAGYGSRPAFMWIDESQFFLMSNDMEFVSTCRDRNVATVMLTQNVNNFYAALSGTEKARAETDSIFGNLNTKLLHASGDPVTNEWMSRVVGRSLQVRMNGNSNYSADDQWTAMLGLDWFGHIGNTSAGFTETLEPEIEPQAFTRLRTGGPAHGWIVDGIVFQNGRVFKSSGRTWLKTSFRQKV